MKILLILTSLIGCLFSGLKSRAQGTDPADSVLYFLKLINGNKPEDSIQLTKITDLLVRNTRFVLLENPAIHNQFQRVKTLLNQNQYYELESLFILSHGSLDTPPYSTIIKYAKEFIAENINNHASYDATGSFLFFLRELRIPYRNSDQIYEGIEYYNSLTKDYLNKNDSNAVTICYNVLAGFYNRLGISEKAEYYMLKSLEYMNDKESTPGAPIIEMVLGKEGKVNRYSVLGSYKIAAGETAEAEKYLKEAITIFESLKNPLQFVDGPFVFIQMARCKSLSISDSSHYYFNEALRYLKQYDYNDWNYSYYFMERGADFLNKGMMDSAVYYIRRSKDLKDSLNLVVTSPWGELIPNYYFAAIKMKQNRPDQAIKLLLDEISLLKQINTRKLVIKELKLLSEAYSEAGMQKESLNALKELLSLKETLDKESNNAKSISFEIEKKMQQTEISIATLRARDQSNKRTRYYLYGITALLALFAATLGFAIFNKQKSNKKLGDKNQELSETLEKLKSTQSQLIQSEKMASLGELTAGIAHEIQNPLNFVNNFSELNTELIEELKSEKTKVKDLRDEQAEKELIEGIGENEKKINHHGKRADAIVKGMLQHSRSSVATKEPTDINSLTDEYLRLASHGFRGKDGSLSVTLKTDFDKTIPPISIIPPDIGRVLLNLYNNAFYAISEKRRRQSQSFEPTISVITKKISDSGGSQIEISVHDNGNGIPQKIVDKIFQPFFTTKPTGQGTGLGLSLSYDIVKAHGGEIRVKTGEGEYTEFIVVLPS